MTKDQIKEHVSEHKALYIVGSLGVVAGFTCIIVRGQCPGVPRVPESSVPRVLDGPTTVTARPLSFFSTRQTTNVVNVIERTGRGHPGYIVHCVETQELFPSQYEAARQLNTSPSIVSGHLNGKLPDVNGVHLERVAAV